MKFDSHKWIREEKQQRLDEDDWKGLDAEVAKYIGKTFASWMSPDHPPFSQEYAKAPYFDKLVKGIMDIVDNQDTSIE